MGKVALGEYDFTLSTWLYRSGRLEIVDFGMLMKTRDVLSRINLQKFEISKIQKVITGNEIPFKFAIK